MNAGQTRSSPSSVWDDCVISSPEMLKKVKDPAGSFNREGRGQWFSNGDLPVTNNPTIPNRSKLPLLSTHIGTWAQMYEPLFPTVMLQDL
jgi:hypothetical protein